MVHAIQNPDDRPQPAIGQPFTADTAAKMLPLVRRIVADMEHLNETVECQRERLDAIDQLPETINQPDYQEELADIRGSLEAEEEQLQAYVRELHALGVEPHIPFDGSVDFPTVINRRAARLCWHLDDDGIEYWHEVDQLTAERQKLDSEILKF
tara:strand:+ start:400 stop:861 length:462 start_codon:yes stop_codon:yes gene_type:complete